MANILTVEEVEGLLLPHKAPATNTTDLTRLWDEIPQTLASTAGMVSGLNFKCSPNVLARLPDKPICVQSRFMGDWPGSVMFVMDANDAATLVHHMLGGNGDAPDELGEDGIPSLCEMFKVALTVLVQSTISDIAGETVTYEIPPVAVKKFLAEPKWIMHTRLMDGDIDIGITTFISSSFISMLGDSRKRIRMRELREGIKNMRKELEELEMGI